MSTMQPPTPSGDHEALPSKSGGPLRIINAGLFRTGTASMAAAYQILGFRCHHGLDLKDIPHHWIQLERAAESIWPDVPNARHPVPAKFTTRDWDVLFGSYDAVTDMGSPFTVQLAEAYPEAKVVVVQRDVDKWEESFHSEIMQNVWGRLSSVLRWTLLPIWGFRGLEAMRKMLLGKFGAKDENELGDKLREGYQAYYDEVRSVIPAHRRLEYRLGQGWEPLCEFLGVPVPQDVPFPRVNDREQHQQKMREERNEVIKDLVETVKPWAGVLAVVSGAVIAVVVTWRR